VGAWSSGRRHDITLGVLRNRIPADFLVVLILTFALALAKAASASAMGPRSSRAPPSLYQACAYCGFVSMALP
jgi:hypothetical protein